MNLFLENARQLFEVARAGDPADAVDFSLQVHADGGLRLLSDPYATSAEARTTYRVTRTARGVRVQGSTGAATGPQTCLLEDLAPLPAWKTLLPDRVLYSVASPLLISGS